MGFLKWDGQMRRFICIAAFLAVISASESPVEAAQWSEAGGRTSIPYGHLDYCKRNPIDCKSHKIDKPVQLTNARLALLHDVTRSVNRRIKPVSDQKNYGLRDYWAIPENGKGDCEDYVLMKRKLLIGRGFSSSQLLITLVQGHEPHVVLTVRTNQGDLILDNMNDDVRPVEKTPYRYIKMQSPAHSGQWETITGRAMSVARK